MQSNSCSFGLALHTVSPDLGLAISNFQEQSRHHVWDLGRDLSTHLHSYLADFLQPQTWTEVAFIAVAIGPGGFTGTRIGVVTARTLAQQLEIPLFGVSTLAAIAHYHLTQMPSTEDTLAIQMPAQRGELFGAIYQLSETGLSPLLADQLLTPDAWQQTLEQWSIPCHPVEAGVGLGGTVSNVLAIAHQAWQRGDRPQWSEVLPFYGQHPVDR